MTSMKTRRSLHRSKVLIAVRQPQDALVSASPSGFHRQVFDLLENKEEKGGQGRLALQVLRRHLRGGSAFSRVRTIVSFSAFARAIQQGVCVVDFYTRWFPLTSKRILELERCVQKLCPKATLVVVDLDAVPLLTTRLSLVVLPTLLVYIDGKPLGHCVGAEMHLQLGALLGNDFASGNRV